MKTRIPLIILAIALAFAVAACAPQTAAPDEGSTPPADGAAGGMRLAYGLYDQEDGTVLALGTLEWIDLEGGFYALTGAPASEGDADGNIAVIANPDEFDELQALLGKSVQVIGTRFDGASIRMAGPEVVVSSIVEISDTPGAAE